MSKALHGLKDQVPEEWLWVHKEVKRFLGELAPTGNHRLFELWKRIPERSTGSDRPFTPLDQLCHLLMRKRGTF